MRRTLVAGLVAGAVAVSGTAGALAARTTTAPDATVNLRLIVKDGVATFSGRPEWSKVMELPRGTYGRMIIHNQGKQPHTFEVKGLHKGPKATIKPGKKVLVVADFLSRGTYRWTVDGSGGGVFRIF